MHFWTHFGAKNIVFQPWLRWHLTTYWATRLLTTLIWCSQLEPQNYFSVILIISFWFWQSAGSWHECLQLGSSHNKPDSLVRWLETPHKNITLLPEDFDEQIILPSYLQNASKCSWTPELFGASSVLYHWSASNVLTLTPYGCPINTIHRNWLRLNAAGDLTDQY
jgi:hypothetical protein